MALANEKVTYIACGGSSSAAVTGTKTTYICTNIFIVNAKQFSELQNFDIWHMDINKTDTVSPFSYSILFLFLFLLLM